jgi:hypothetical protein
MQNFTIAFIHRLSAIGWLLFFHINLSGRLFDYICIDAINENRAIVLWRIL